MAVSFYYYWVLADSSNPITHKTLASREDIPVLFAGTVVYWAIIWGLNKLAKPFVLANFIDLARYDTPEVQQKRAVTLSKYLVDLLSYSASSLYAYVLLKDRFLVTWFGGTDPNSTCSNLIDYSIGTADPTLGNFMRFQLVIHFYKLFHHIFVNLYESKYYEFLLHHGLAFLLMIFGYTTNLWTMASCTLLLHDVSDVFLLAVRLMADYRHRNKNMTYVLFGVNCMVWFYSRTVYLPICIIRPLAKTALSIHLSPRPEE